MGLLDVANVVGKVIGKVLEGAKTVANENAERQKQARERLGHYSDEQLFNELYSLMKKHDVKESVAVRKLLRDRGYESEEISEKMRSRFQG